MLGAISCPPRISNSKGWLESPRVQKWQHITDFWFVNWQMRKELREEIFWLFQHPRSLELTYQALITMWFVWHGVPPTGAVIHSYWQYSLGFGSFAAFESAYFTLHSTLIASLAVQLLNVKTLPTFCILQIGFPFADSTDMVWRQFLVCQLDNVVLFEITGFVELACFGF